MENVGPRESDTCRESADLLREGHPYFYWPVHDALVGWRKSGGHCVYCNKNIMSDWETLLAYAHTDHLLPRKYTELLRDEWNLVLCCSVCNSLKGAFDANAMLSEITPPTDGGRYTSGPHLTEQQHINLVEICKTEVRLRREEKSRYLMGAIAAWKAA